MSEQRKGSLLVLAAGMAWGLSGVSGQYLMKEGMDVMLLACLRLTIAGLVLTAIAFATQKERFYQAIKQPKFLRGSALFSLSGLLLNQYAYLSAIHHTNAGTATVLQYIAPILLLGAMCLKQRRLPMLVELLAMLLTVTGTYLMVTQGRLDGLAITPIGLFFGSLSAITYALYILLPAPLIREWGSLIVIGVGMLMAGITLSLVSRVWQYELILSFDRLLALFGIVGVGTVFAYTAFLKGTTSIGAVKGSLLGSVEPVSSVVFGMLLMKDSFHLMDLIGIVFILLAVFLISLHDMLRLRRQHMRNH